MPGIIIKVPGISLPAGSLVLNRRFRGFPKSGLQNLYLFEDGSVTAPVSSAGLATPATVAGGGTATLLSGGGGLQIDASKTVSAPSISFRSAWTLICGGRINTTTYGVAPAGAPILGFSQFATYGTLLFANRSPVPWDTNSALTTWQRNASNGVTGVITSATGTQITPDDGVMWLHSFDGVSTLASASYSKTGALLNSVSQTIDPIAATTNASAVVLTSLNPCLGSTAALALGSLSAEAFAVYNKILSGAEITSLAVACAALGAARGRAW